MILHQRNTPNTPHTCIFKCSVVLSFKRNTPIHVYL